MSTVGKRLLSSLVYTNDLQQYIKLSLEPYLFKDTELPLYELMAAHIAKYGKIPSQSTIEDISGFEDALVDAPEPPQFYMDEVEKRYLHNSLKATVQEASMLLTDKLSEAALDVIMKHASTLHRRKQRKHLFDFRESSDLIKDAYLAQKVMGTEIMLPYGWETLDNMSGGMRGGDFVTFVGRPMAGKAQPLDSKILTTKGWTTMGQLQVGDELASVDGKPSKVLELFPQGMKPVYRLTFQDGRACEASDEHLWEVWYRDWADPKVITTLQLIALLEKKRYQGRLSVRLFSGDYGTLLPSKFSPYLLGALVGDGCFRGPAPTFSTEDVQLWARLNSELEPHGLQLVHTDRCNFRITGKGFKRNPLKEWLKDLGLWRCKSEEKVLPVWVMRMARPQRLELLQGLLDTDGTAGEKGDVSFSTSSPRLAKQVQELVWSLGGRARITPKKTTHLTSYRLSIVFQDRAQLFALDRKRERVQEVRTRKANTRLRIESVEFIGEKECQCISVSHKDHLYITDNYTVTHNTFKLLYTALNAWRTAGRVPLFVSMEMTALIIQQRLAAMTAKKKLTDIIKAELSTKAFNAMMDTLHDLKQAEVPFWVMDANLTSTPEDVLFYCHQLQPSAVFVDGAYLMEGDKKMGKWDVQADNARKLKQRIATDLDVPVVASYQLSKGSAKAKKKGKGEPDGMEDVHGSDEMAQLSTVMLGLFDDETNIEAKKRRTVKILKGRNGETGQFTINWDFSANMNFTEYVPEDPTTMQMEHLG